MKDQQPQPVEVKGKTLICNHCGHDHFWQKNVLLNTRTASFFNFDWANRNAVTFVCAECTCIHWFYGS